MFSQRGNYLKITLNDYISVNSLSTNFTKWSNTLKQFVGKLPTNCLSVFDHFAALAFKGLKNVNMLKAVSLKRICKDIGLKVDRHLEEKQET